MQQSDSCFSILIDDAGTRALACRFIGGCSEIDQSAIKNAKPSPTPARGRTTDSSHEATEIWSCLMA